jgi:2-dehydropantoate 2-reductase
MLGHWRGPADGRVEQIAALIRSAGLEVRVAPNVRQEIWSKLALNVCTLPTTALLRLEAGRLLHHPELLELMGALLRETVTVARALELPLDYDERWAAITGLLGRIAPGAKSSMHQDVEARRRTEIDVINGAIAAAGRELKIATPVNDSMVWMVRALENTFQP